MNISLGKHVDLSDSALTYFPLSRSFTAPLQPFSASSNMIRELQDSNGSNHPSTRDPTTQVVNVTSAQATATSFQEFYEALEGEMSNLSTLTDKQSLLVKYGDGHQGDLQSTEGGLDTADGKLSKGAEDIVEALEKVEACVTNIFYDQWVLRSNHTKPLDVCSALCFVFRLFSPSLSDDASHDDALSSRIAALNMLDLGWDHLGVEIDNDAPGAQRIDEVVTACGKGEPFS